jgi:U3 small nucleolar RNA-associated protein 25
MFGSYLTPEINNLWSTYCMNVNKGGRVKIRPIEKGSIRRVIANVQQIFTRFPCKSVAGADDARFEYFTKKVPIMILYFKKI